jgi:hypothetical protein
MLKRGTGTEVPPVPVRWPLVRPSGQLSSHPSTRREVRSENITNFSVRDNSISGAGVDGSNTSGSDG